MLSPVARTAALICAFLLSLALTGSTAPAQAASEAPASPAMGWNSWNSGIALNEQNIEQVIDAMVSSGMRDAGYRYVNLDAGWAAPERDAKGDIQADPTEFPHGMAALADYAHARGLLLGLYSSPYNQTCGQTPENASLGHETQDAQTFAGWGIDYLKYDWCRADTDHATEVKNFTAMRDALRATGHRIVYSINPNSAADVHVGTSFDWSGIADSARITGDLIPMWHNALAEQELPDDQSTRELAGITDEIALDETVTDRSKPGYANDPDMLVVGIGLPEFFVSHLGMMPAIVLKGVLTQQQLQQLGAQLQAPPDVLAQLRAQPPNPDLTEQRSHFSLWAMMSAPLLAGNDIRGMAPEVRDILTNRAVIALDQDPAHQQARNMPGDNRILVKPLSDGSIAVAACNTGDTAATIATAADAIGLPHAARYTVTDLWSHATSTTTGPIVANDIPPHGTTLLRLTPAR